MQEVRLAVVWAVLYSDIIECVPSPAIWVLCVNCGMGNTCPGWSICERSLALTSGPASGVLCYNEDLSRQKPHLLIMGYKRGVVRLHATLLRYLTWLGVVSFSCHLHVSEQS